MQRILGTITYVERAGEYFMALFRRRNLSKNTKEVVQISPRTRAYEYLGVYKGSADFEEARFRARIALGEAGVRVPDRAIVSTHVVPVQTISEMRNIFENIQICSDWDGKTAVRPENLYMLKGKYFGQHLGMMTPYDMESFALNENRYVVIAYDRTAKSYTPLVLTTDTKGYQRTSPIHTYYQTRLNDISSASVEDAFYLAGLDYASPRTPRDILETHVLSVNRRTDLQHIEIDVARAPFNSPLTLDRIRGVRINRAKAADALVPVQSSLPIEECVRPTQSYDVNSFMLRSRGVPFARDSLVR